MVTESTNVIASEGKYTILNFTMSTDTAALELTNMAVTCEIFESILSPSIIMKAKMYDATGAFTTFDFTSKEVELCLSFTTNSRGTPIHYRTRVIESKGEPVAEGKGFVFELLAVSAEAVTSATLEDFQLRRDKIEADKIVGAILDGTIKTEKNQYFDKTKGLRNYTFTKVKPFDAIQRVTRKALSDKYESNAFVFFENHKGYWFKCIESLIEEGKKNIGDKVFFNHAAAKADSSGSNWRNILSYATIQKGGQNLLLATGANKVRIVLEDINKAPEKWPPPIERSSKDFNFVTLNDGGAVRTQATEDENTKNTGKVIRIEYDSLSEDDTQIEKVAGVTIYLAQLLTVVLHINIYGDSEITCGDVITCYFKEAQGLNKAPEDDPVLSGNYLVTKCRHNLTFGDTPEYFQALEIVKDSMLSNLDPVCMEK